MLPSEKLTGVVLVFQQFVALYVKRFCNSKRNLKGFFCEVVLSKIVLIFVSKIFWRLFFLLLSQWIFRLFCLRCSSLLTNWLQCRLSRLLQSPHFLYHHGYTESRLLLSMPIKIQMESGQTITSATWWMIPVWEHDVWMITCHGNIHCFCLWFCFERSKHFIFYRLACSKNITGLLNPSVNPDDYEDFRCPCSKGITYCPGNLTSAELPRYRSVSSDEFYDLTGKDISLWIIRTYKTLKKSRYVTVNQYLCPAILVNGWTSLGMVVSNSV